jgi:DNA-binding SARP family transcriptional activator
LETTLHRGDRRPPLLRIHLLGRFEVVREDAPIPAQAWRRRRPADLLKLVALTPGRALPRERVIAALWPDKDPASGANNLHRALYDLRQILGGRWVDIERATVKLRPEVWLDVDAFEAAVAAGARERWTEGVALYRGDLCPEDLESPWLHARRSALRGRFAEAAAPLARVAAEEGDPGTSIPLLRRLLEVDPAAEDAHRLLMRLLAQTGRRGEALRQYDACEDAVRAAGRAVADETRAVRVAIQRGELGPSQSRPTLDGARRAARRLLGTTDPAPVRGRAALLLLFESLVERGSGALVLLGERGVGKTRLAVEGARIAQARGAAVLTGVAAPPGGAGAGAPYGLFADLFRDEAKVNPAAPDPFADAAGARSPEAVRRRVLEAVERGLLAAADGKPLYLLLDDLHLADESSLHLLHHLARRAPALRLMIGATCREEEVHAGTPIQMALAHLDAGRLARGVRVPRLSLAGTREQVADLLGAPVSEPLLAQLYRATDGCPYLVEEAILSHGPGQAIPSDPSAALRARVAQLGVRVEALLSAAAVAGRRFDFEVVRHVTGLTAHEAVAALEACLDARLLEEDGAGYHFHSALARDLLYAGLTPERRASLHASVADALEAALGIDAPPEALAHHRRRAGELERAVRHLTAAGHRAAARAGLGEAAGFYAEALSLLTPGDGPRRLELLDAAARVQLGLGELTGAARAFAEAARLEVDGFRPPPEQRARLHRLAAVALGAGGALAPAEAELAEGLAAAGDHADEAAALHHLRAQLLWHAGRHADARAAAEACVAAAAIAADADLAARARDLMALAAVAAGEPPPAAAETAAGADRDEQDTAPEHPVDLHAVLWDDDLLRDAPAAELARAAGALVERARLRDSGGALACGRLGEGTFALAAGQLEAAELSLRAALDGYRAAGSALGEALALEKLGELLTVRGRLDEARQVLGDGVLAAERATLRAHALVRLHVAQARNLLAAGLAGAAEEAIREASETAARHGACASCDVNLRAEAVRVALSRGRVAEAEGEAAALEETARLHGGKALGALARLARARVLGGQGRIEDGLVALAQARAALLAAGLRLEAARAVRLEARLRGAGGLAPRLGELEALVVVDGDA